MTEIVLKKRKKFRAPNEKTLLTVTPLSIFDKGVGERMRAKRRILDITMEEFCARIDNKLSTGRLSRVELGQLSLPISLVEQTTVALDCTIEYLFGFSKKSVGTSVNSKLDFLSAEEFYLVEKYAHYLIYLRSARNKND